MAKKTKEASGAKERIRPLRIDKELDAEIKRVGGTVRLSDADVMRLAIERGLPVVEKLLRRPSDLQPA